MTYYKQFSLAPATGVPNPQQQLGGFVVTGIAMMQDTVAVGTRWLDVTIGHNINRSYKLKVLNGPDFMPVDDIEDMFSCEVDSPVPVLSIGITLRGYYKSHK